MTLVQLFKNNYLLKAELFDKQKGLSLLKDDKTIYIIADSENGDVISNDVRTNMLNALQFYKEDKVFVTLFGEKNDFSKLSDKISWDTYVWIASEPNHTIHFERKPTLKPRKSQ